MAASYNVASSPSQYSLMQKIKEDVFTLIFLVAAHGICRIRRYTVCEESDNEKGVVCVYSWFFVSIKIGY